MYCIHWGSVFRKNGEVPRAAFALKGRTVEGVAPKGEPVEMWESYFSENPAWRIHLEEQDPWQSFAGNSSMSNMEVLPDTPENKKRFDELAKRIENAARFTATASD